MAFTFYGRPKTRIRKPPPAPIRRSLPPPVRVTDPSDDAELAELKTQIAATRKKIAAVPEIPAFAEGPAPVSPSSVNSPFVRPGTRGPDLREPRDEGEIGPESSTHDVQASKGMGWRSALNFAKDFFGPVALTLATGGALGPLTALKTIPNVMRAGLDARAIYTAQEEDPFWYRGENEDSTYEDVDFSGSTTAEDTKSEGNPPPTFAGGKASWAPYQSPHPSDNYQPEAPGYYGWDDATNWGPGLDGYVSPGTVYGYGGLADDYGGLADDSDDSASGGVGSYGW